MICTLRLQVLSQVLQLKKPIFEFFDSTDSDQYICLRQKHNPEHSWVWEFHVTIISGNVSVTYFKKKKKRCRKI